MNSPDELIQQHKQPTSDTGRGRYVYERDRIIRIRCAAVVVRGDEILLVRHRTIGEEHWSLPQGGVAIGKSPGLVTAHKLSEECGIRFRGDRLLFVAKSLAHNDRHRVLNLVFLARLADGGTDFSVSTSMQPTAPAWVNRSMLPALTLKPNFGEALLRHWQSGFSLNPENLGSTFRD